MVQEKIWMLLLVIGILSSFQSCGSEDTDPGFTISYAYTNNSNHGISIEKWEGEYYFTYDLAQAEILNFRIEFVIGGCYFDNEAGGVLGSECPLVVADSLKITYDNEKFLVLKRDDTGGANIFNHENYQYSINGNQELYEYEFTQKDYLVAQ